MFGKNLKYELRASSRVLLPLFICTLAISVFISAGFALFGNMYFGTEETESKFSQTFEAIGSAAMTLLFMAFVILVMVTAVAVLVLMVRRFYTSFFTDEAYLTFTLPVSVDCHIATKTVATVIWYVGYCIVTVISALIVIVGAALGTLFSGVADSAGESVEYVGNELESIFGGSVIFMILNYIIAAFASLFLIYFAISFGCMIAKKHRFISCVLCYFVISGAVSFISNIVTSVVMIPLTYALDDIDLYLMITYLISTVLSAAELVGCYFGTRFILTKKVNLP